MLFIRQSPQGVEDCPPQVRKPGLDGLTFRDDHQIQPERIMRQKFPNQLAQPPFYPVPHNSAADLLPDGKTEPALGKTVGERIQDHVTGRNSVALVENFPEIALSEERRKGLPAS
ncbi:MAG: hypothetical protein OHK006_17250 [Thermodesulfovibrionales bacterium]